MQIIIGWETGWRFIFKVALTKVDTFPSVAAKSLYPSLSPTCQVVTATSNSQNPSPAPKPLCPSSLPHAKWQYPSVTVFSPQLLST